MSDWRKEISHHSKWDCDSACDSLDGKWEGSPVDRVLASIEQGSAITGVSSFSNHYNVDQEVWYDADKREWSWRSSYDSYTQAGEISGKHREFDWIKSYRSYMDRNKAS